MGLRHWLELRLAKGSSVCQPGCGVRPWWICKSACSRRKKKLRAVASKELQRSASSHAPVSIAVGPIRDMLTDAARRLRADVLVIGRSPASGVLGRLRDPRYALPRAAPCPLLSV